MSIHQQIMKQEKGVHPSFKDNNVKYDLQKIKTNIKEAINGLKTAFQHGAKDSYFRIEDFELMSYRCELIQRKRNFTSFQKELFDLYDHYGNLVTRYIKNKDIRTNIR